MANKWKGPIPEQIKRVAEEMSTSAWSEVDMATLITRDKESGILTIISMTENGLDQSALLFDAMAHMLKYAKVQ